jgi:tetratricopeptide (TPR) repeat protein
MMRQALAINPTDVLVTRVLGELYLRLGKLREAEALLRRALDLAPSCTVTRDRYCLTLIQLMEWKDANAQLELLLKDDPGNPRLEAQLAANYIMLGAQDEGMRLFEKVRPESVNDKVFWLNYGHAARTVGKDDQTIISAYRKCLEIDPTYGTAWWGLADMKTYRFSQAEIATMRNQLKRENIPDGQRCHLEFALGRALEDERAHAESFEHYSRANALRRPYIYYSADAVHTDVMRAKAFFTPRERGWAVRRPIPSSSSECRVPDPP